MTTRRALVCGLMPEPDRDSGSRRVLQVLDVLQTDGWAITFVSHHAKAPERYARALQRRGISVYFGSAKWMDQLIATQEYDLSVLALWEIAEAYVARIRRNSPATRIVIDSIDLHFVRQARRAFREVSEGGSPAALDADYGAALVRELNTYAASDAVLTVSDKETALVNDLLGDPSTGWTAPLCEERPPIDVPLAERSGILYVGCYRFPPNVDAVAYLCRDIVPKIDATLLERHPIYIVGDGLDDKVRALGAGLPHVRMVGWVPSVAPYLARVRISVVPLRYGAGTKGKLVQSLMAGTPVVSTSIGIEGLNLADGTHAMVADDPAAFAQGVDRLLRDARLWKRLQRGGRDHVERVHGREPAAASLRRAISMVMNKPAKRGIDAVDRPKQWTKERYTALVAEICRVAEEKLPPGAAVAVISKGDNNLLNLGDRRAWHFPSEESGEYSGHYPASSEEAIQQLQRLTRIGASHLLIPAPSAWWLEHYAGLRQHLDREWKLVFDRDDLCSLYERRAEPSVVVLPDATVAGGADQSEDAPDERARLIAFLLPQFHPIPENDAWWGSGFTEWTNVTNARPLFPGHYQPKLPADLGFYDLRLAETRERQATLAHEYGLHGFCYYHYWFGGKQLLERPFNEVLASGEPDFPFCLCWANEPWSRRWDGRPTEVLQAQSYSAEDDRAHIQWLIPALSDPRAIQINGKPVFLVYQGRELPDPGRTIEVWREEANKAGLGSGLYLIAVETGWDAGWDATAVGFDAKLLFQPQFSMLFGSGTRLPAGQHEQLRVFDYQKAWPLLANPEPVTYPRYETVCPRWDNTARSTHRGVVLHGSTPEAYQTWLEHAIVRAHRQPAGARVVFINAWNEWAEGAYLEPDRRHGLAYLEATRAAIESTRRLRQPRGKRGRR